MGLLFVSTFSFPLVLNSNISLQDRWRRTPALAVGKNLYPSWSTTTP